MKVRPYREEDFAAVCRVYLDAKREELRGEPSRVAITPLEDDPAISAAFAASEVIVLEYQGEVQGFLAFRGEELRALFVHASVRGVGAGTALMAGFAPPNVERTVVLVARSNLGARRFYERHGFRDAGEVTREYGGVAIDYLRLERPA